MSLTALYKERQSAQLAQDRELERRRRLAMQSVEAVTAALLDGVNSGVAEVFANQRRIEERSRLLQAQTTTFSKQTANWLQLVEKFYSSLKELGDIENWAMMLETDMQAVASALTYCQKSNSA